MKVLGIVGSPRKGGNTDVLVERVLEGARKESAQVEKLYLRDFEIHPCQGAFSCEVAQRCILPDDMHKIYPKMHEAAGIVMGTPIYMANVSGPLVNFIDRCRPFISYLDSLGKVRLTPEEKKTILEEKTCWHLWQGSRTYSESGSRAEEAMEAVIKSFTDKHTIHPSPDRRLPRGKKGVVILSYHRHGENTYQPVANFFLFVLKEIWEFGTLDIISADRLLKRGDAQKRDELWQRVFEAGRRMVQGS